MTLPLATAAAEFAGATGYLAAATSGLPPRAAVQALTDDLAEWTAGRRDAVGYDRVVAATRASYARLVGVAPERVAIGSQTSALVSLIAAAAPRGAEIVLPHGDFSSLVFPFQVRPDLQVRTVPLDELADAIRPTTWLAAFSVVQSATGAVAPIAAITAAARAAGALTLADLTQAAGVLPVDATLFDATVCHSYKWLCAPRGVAFLTITPELAERVSPAQAGWYAGDDVWASCYGPSIHLASDARRFDVSPAWEAWVGAEHSIGLFAQLDIAEVWTHASGLGDALARELGCTPQQQAIVTWPDPDGAALAALGAAGLRASGRAGRVRLAFHLWNTRADVDAAAAALLPLRAHLAAPARR
ncbi:aminotransferase class V-fold PLP-dependent enzyme [Schumannella sp. 10F1B-5-1]|uniref:aminotransferase class V-fold PLP-dependent enzyme n=1 Tax=Schumannella sp. 10F1B-5-1 TaxID=2590780 RepID=UPI001130EB1B|nr:aminotransferase class V-fold PLP-dependent enzyme [Schumannella sp. 10F1B-5-1]TPW70808.1 aminotransferase class V-fold PLP-dependent enzyme [Schumannella sp. 10F1B-5-1]